MDMASYFKLVDPGEKLPSEENFKEELESANKALFLLKNSPHQSESGSLVDNSQSSNEDGDTPVKRLTQSELDNYILWSDCKMDEDTSSSGSNKDGDLGRYNFRKRARMDSDRSWSSEMLYENDSSNENDENQDLVKDPSFSLDFRSRFKENGIFPDDKESNTDTPGTEPDVIKQKIPMRKTRTDVGKRRNRKRSRTYNPDMCYEGTKCREHDVLPPIEEMMEVCSVVFDWTKLGTPFGQFSLPM